MSRDPRRLLEQYIDDVQHPDVSAFELLDLLQTRSVLATLEAQLSTDERQRLRVRSQESGVKSQVSG
ncbi:MAG TPA: hypothetical protein VGC99_24290 [Candidatus Tectomicrobia bacterium]